MMVKNKRGISIMIGYVLLITTSIIISAIVYQWIITYVPTDPIECPDGVSVFIKESEYNCQIGELNLTLKNNGRFNTGGYLIWATTSPDQDLASEDLSPYTPLGIETGGAVIFQFLKNSMKPNDEIKNIFDLNNTSFGQIYSIEIIPIRIQDKGRINCVNARVKETLSCSVAEECVPNTCAGLGGYVCGNWNDGCGGILNCNQPGCDVTEFCDGIGQCISTSCTPAPDPSLPGICGTQDCGVATNNTCGSVNCEITPCGDSGLSCNITIGQCVLVCGDDIVGGTEQCDDGNTNNNDDCIIDTDSSYECMNSVCGDGYLWNQGTGTEQCDDGNLIDGDGCSNTCQIEPGYLCAEEPSVCEIDSSIDSCSDYCALFTGYVGGGCLQNPQQCEGLDPPWTYIGNVPGADETLGNGFCSIGNADTCCCKP